MLLLSADTSGKHGSIALAQCGPGKDCEVLEVVALTGGTFSAQLIPQIAALLAKHAFGKRDIRAFTVVSGPGSFTGIRVGLAVIKALAEILDKPIAAVSLLEAVASADGKKGRVLAALEAGRSEIYAGEYEIDANIKMLSERLVTREEFLSAATGLQIVTPDASIIELARDAGVEIEAIERPRSDAIVRLGWEKILAGETVLPENLEANYLRRSGAELFGTLHG